MSTISGINLESEKYNITLPLLDDFTTTTAGSSTSGSYLAARWAVANVNGITTPVNGMTIAVRVPLAGNSGGVLLSIDGGTTYYPIVRNVNTLVTTTYAVGSTIILTFNPTQTASPYLTAGTTTTVTGCWQTADYDANTKTSSGTSEKTATKLYLVGATSQSSSGVTTYSNKLCYVGTDNCLYSNGTKVLTSDADTKNTAGSTNSSKKLFLIGAESQAANPQTYSHNTAYVGTDGCLYSNSTKVSVDGHTHSYAGSSSAGGAASRVANQLTMYIGGTNSVEQKIYDGSEAIEIDVASSGHEHDDYAPKASPALTGTPTAPTAAAGTNTTQIATTAFVTNAVSKCLPLEGGTVKGNMIVGGGYSLYFNARGSQPQTTPLPGGGTVTTYPDIEKVLQFEIDHGVEDELGFIRLEDGSIITPGSHPINGNSVNYKGLLLNSLNATQVGYMQTNIPIHMQRKPIRALADPEYDYDAAHKLYVDTAISNAMSNNSQITYGTTDLVAGSSTLETGKLYFVYE